MDTNRPPIRSITQGTAIYTTKPRRSLPVLYFKKARAPWPAPSRIAMTRIGDMHGGTCPASASSPSPARQPRGRYRYRARLARTCTKGLQKGLQIIVRGRLRAVRGQPASRGSEKGVEQPRARADVRKYFFCCRGRASRPGYVPICIDLNHTSELPPSHRPWALVTLVTHSPLSAKGTLRNHPLRCSDRYQWDLGKFHHQ